MCMYFLPWYVFVYLYEICFYTYSSDNLRYFYYWVLYYLNYLRDFDVSVAVPV